MKVRRIFNTQIDHVDCKQHCRDGWLRDEQDRIIKDDNNQDKRCACYYQNKYIDSNIGTEYWPIVPDTFEGHPQDLEEVSKYWTRLPQIKESGEGLYLHGTYGSGKTTLGILTLKVILHCTKFSVFVAPFSDLVILNSRIVGGFHDKDAVNDIEYIKNVDFLLIDDLGKEFDNGKDYARATLNSTIRYRDMWKKPTIYTANVPMEDLKEHYGSSNYSILNGRSKIITMKNTIDYRKIKKFEKEN